MGKEQLFKHFLQERKQSVGLHQTYFLKNCKLTAYYTKVRRFYHRMM